MSKTYRRYPSAYKKGSKDLTPYALRLSRRAAYRDRDDTPPVRTGAYRPDERDNWTNKGYGPSNIYMSIIKRELASECSPELIARQFVKRQGGNYTEWLDTAIDAQRRCKRSQR